ncbi:hypothetical protein SAMN04488074_101304 [Lentzea albidocapillata subsp. violacea]|uniref:Peptidase inhibitor family I36 n=1 Tax=Lentzea albidocapillata subsp. violacea TaxID=128104 RepID=A0A1G8QD84_9PSEU|nr:hypothetical protein [Lentzea albidocapillata]SDJ02405.1 hypothetical protein SAMN04488074_101304 [Lentzea albidocapillata subsp. violacea]
MRRTLMAVLASAAALVAVPGTSQAADDVGDGNLACNTTEICFRWAAGDDGRIKHFRNGANHHYVAGVHNAYVFGGTVGANDSPRKLVMDNAQQIRNRDTVCSVTLWDVDGAGRWYQYYTQPNNSVWSTVVADRNNGHSRCQEGAPVNR